MLIPPGFANIQFRMIDNGNQHLYLTAIGVELEGADPATVAAGMKGAWDDNYAAFVGNEVDGQNLAVIIGTADPSAPITYDGGGFAGGSASSDTAPPNVALLIRKSTLLGGRAGRGRMFLPKPTEGGFDENGLLSEGQFGALVAATIGFQEDAEAVDGVARLVLFHNSESLDPSTITQLQAQQLVATQRRRLRR